VKKKTKIVAQPNINPISKQNGRDAEKNMYKVRKKKSNKHASDIKID
jgi:hypothetical protein